MATQPTPVVTVDPVIPEVTPEVITPEPAAVLVSGENDIEKGADGLYRLVVGNKVYKAKTIKALLQETAKAIANGDVRIKELNTELKIKRGTIVPDTGDDLVLPQVAPISADEAFQLSQDMLRPEGLPKAVRRVIEAELGAPLETIKSEREATRSAQFRERAFAAGRDFVQAHPEFIASRSNEEKMFEFMEQKNILPISLKNYDIAYAQIKDTLDLREEIEEPAAAVVPAVVPVVPPVVPAAASTPAAPARARQATTGVTSRNSSAPSNAAPTIAGLPGYPTRDEYNRMSSKEVQTRMERDPRFEEHVNLLFATKK